MINASIIDKGGHPISISNLKEIRFDGYDDVKIITDFDTFQKEDHITYAFIGENRTLNIAGIDIKCVLFDK